MAVVGIDLGTTNTVVGVVRDGQAHTLADARGQTLVPSVVSFPADGSTLVGYAARERRPKDPRNTVYSVKRLIGRSWSSEEVTRARERFPFEMKEGPGQAALVVARGETFTLPEISAFVLRHIKASAERALGEEVDRAVITVPANFNDLQRAATKVAGRVSGLDVMRILNEPTAAALAYGYGKSSKERVAIYDFGGGTFDVTLLDLSGNVFEVLATAGNTFLGGDDVDLRIAQRMAEVCFEQHRFDPRTDRESFERLRLAAEGAKIALASEDTHGVAVSGLGPGGTYALDFTFTARELDALAEPVIDQTFTVCQEVLDLARLRPADLDQVVLVGGSTRLRLVARRVAEFFGKEPLDHINPEEVVAIGAAIQASALTGTGGKRGTIPNPPKPAGRTTESRVGRPPLPSRRPKSGPPMHPAARSRTNPEARLASPDETVPRRRLTTGMGLGPTKQALAPVPPQSKPAQPARIPHAAGEAAPTLPSLEAALAGGFAAVEADAHRLDERDEPRAVAPPPPLLIDVTPLTLCVETVGGYCDALIHRNTPVPCSQSRAFVTAADDQTTVRVRVGQGESARFDENTALGEVELSDLQPGPRGMTQIVVTFSLDTDGLLEVLATDAATGKNARARLTLIGVPEQTEDLDALASRNAERAR